MKKEGCAPTEEYLRHFRREIELYADCAEPGKPIWHDNHRLARGMRGYTGYVNSTPIESWTDEQKLCRWRFLQVRAANNLSKAETGMTRIERALQILKNANGRFVSADDIAVIIGGSHHSIVQLIETIEKKGCKIEHVLCFRLEIKKRVRPVRVAAGHKKGETHEHCNSSPLRFKANSG